MKLPSVKAKEGRTYPRLVLADCVIFLPLCAQSTWHAFSNSHWNIAEFSLKIAHAWSGVPIYCYLFFSQHNQYSIGKFVWNKGESIDILKSTFATFCPIYLIRPQTSHHLHVYGSQNAHPPITEIRRRSVGRRLLERTSRKSHAP